MNDLYGFWEWIESWAALPYSLYELLTISLWATGTALVILLVKRFFREQLSARWHLYIWLVLIARMVLRPGVLTFGSNFSLAKLTGADRAAAALRFAIDSHRMGVDAAGNMAGLAAAAAGETAAGIDSAMGSGAAAQAAAGAVSHSSGMTFLGAADPSLYDVPIAEFLGPQPMVDSFQTTAMTVYWICVAAVACVFIGAYLRLMMKQRSWTLVGKVSQKGWTLADRIAQTANAAQSRALLLQVFNCVNRIWGDGELKLGADKVQVYTADNIDGPFVCGVFRRKMVLPEDMLPLEDSVILHELIHLRHNHLAFNWMVTGFRCLHFFNPVLWYAFRQMNNDCELLCDQRVLELMGKDQREEHEQYGQTLLNTMGRGRTHYPGTTNLSNGQKNVLRRIRRIREFWKLSGASTLIALILTVLTGAYCLSVPSGTYALEELPSAFGFGTGAFDYHVYYAERYRLKTPLEAAYAYGLALTHWDVTYEWMFLTDEERRLRKEQKIENEEDGLSSLHDLDYLQGKLGGALQADLDEDTHLDLIVDIINTRNNSKMSLYNFHRRADGTYRTVLRLDFGLISDEIGRDRHGREWVHYGPDGRPLEQSEDAGGTGHVSYGPDGIHEEPPTGYGTLHYVEDHDIIIGIRDGRYQVISDVNRLYLLDVDKSSLYQSAELDQSEIVIFSDIQGPYVYLGGAALPEIPFHAEDDGMQYLDYRMDCYTINVRQTHRWKENHMPEEMTGEVRVRE